ncbi:MAG: flagellar hook-associated protein FlgL [bacterium]
MRISNEAMTRTMLGYLQRGRASVYDLQQQISSGLRVQRPSDDPGAYSLIRYYQMADAATRQFQVNTTRTEGRLGVTDGKLQDLSNMVQRVSELVVSGSDGTKSPADRKAMGEEINQYVEDAVALANTTHEGEYIFAGLRTDTVPYTVTRDANGKISAVTYQGNQDTRSVEIGENVYVPANLPGSDTASEHGVFQSSDTDVFADLIHIRDRLMAGENLAGTEDCTADATADTLTIKGVYATGSTVRLSTTGVLPAGLNGDTDYYAIRISPTEIRLALTMTDARAGTAIDFTDNGTGQLSVAQQSLGDIGRYAEHQSAIMARVGAYQERVALSVKVLNANVLNNAKGIEREASADVAAAATELASRQTAYQASLAITSKMMNMSLLDYI